MISTQPQRAVGQADATDGVIQDDLNLLWSDQRRIITGANLLARIFEPLGGEPLRSKCGDPIRGFVRNGSG